VNLWNQRVEDPDPITSAKEFVANETANEPGAPRNQNRLAQNLPPRN
jgi:hypothetical protein